MGLKKNENLGASTAAAAQSFGTVMFAISFVSIEEFVKCHQCFETVAQLMNKLKKHVNFRQERIEFPNLIFLT